MIWIVCNDSCPQVPYVDEFDTLAKAREYLANNSSPGDRLIGPFSHEVWWWDGTYAERLDLFESALEAMAEVERLVCEEGGESRPCLYVIPCLAADLNYAKRT